MEETRRRIAKEAGQEKEKRMFYYFVNQCLIEIVALFSRK
jgi:hypothetical protein